MRFHVAYMLCMCACKVCHATCQFCCGHSLWHTVAGEGSLLQFTIDAGLDEVNLPIDCLLQYPKACRHRRANWAPHRILQCRCDCFRLPPRAATEVCWWCGCHRGRPEKLMLMLHAPPYHCNRTNLFICCIIQGNLDCVCKLCCMCHT